MDVELAILFGWSAVVCFAIGVAVRLQTNNRKAIKEVSLKVREINILLNAVMDNIEDRMKTVDAHVRKDDAEAKMIGCALADRIDALSARMDAVELACGIREKAKTAGGVD